MTEEELDQILMHTTLAIHLREKIRGDGQMSWLQCFDVYVEDFKT